MSVFYERYSAALYDVILQVVKNEDQAEAVLQDSLAKIWSLFYKYDPSHEELFTWAAKICRNLSIDTFRSRQSPANRSSDENLSISHQHDSTGLNPVQVSLLQVFEREMSEEETLRLRRLMVRSYLEIMRQEAGRIDDERGYTAEDYEWMLNEPS